MRLSSVGGIVAFTLGMLWLPLATNAQRAQTVPRIGWLEFRSPSDAGGFPGALEIFRQGLRERGYVEGQSIAIEYRFAEGRLERLPALAAELVRLKVEVIVTWGPGISAAKDATTTIPIVMASTLDAVRWGLVASLARPGGNVTGLTGISFDLIGKRLELLKEALPNISRLALLRYVESQTAPGAGALLVKEAEETAQALGMSLHILEVRDPDDLESAFAAMARERADALYGVESALLHTQRIRIIALATQHRLPTMFWRRTFVDAGSLMSYGPSQPDMWRRAATYVDKLLKGAKPADLPVEQPTKFELVINLKTAKALGLTIPPTLLFQADEVIR